VRDLASDEVPILIGKLKQGVVGFKGHDYSIVDPNGLAAPAVTTAQLAAFVGIQPLIPPADGDEFVSAVDPQVRLVPFSGPPSPVRRVTNGRGVRECSADTYGHRPLNIHERRLGPADDADARSAPRLRNAATHVIGGQHQRAGGNPYDQLAVDGAESEVEAGTALYPRIGQYPRWEPDLSVHLTMDCLALIWWRADDGFGE